MKEQLNINSCEYRCFAGDAYIRTNDKADLIFTVSRNDVIGFKAQVNSQNTSTYDVVMILRGAEPIELQKFVSYEDARNTMNRLSKLLQNKKIINVQIG